MKNLFARIEAIEKALAPGCAACEEWAGDAATDEELLKAFFAPCPRCGKERTFLDLYPPDVAALTAKGLEMGMYEHD